MKSQPIDSCARIGAPAHEPVESMKRRVVPVKGPSFWIDNFVVDMGYGL